MKKYYPMMFDIHNKSVVVIGGGSIAYRKVISLLSYGAIVTVIAPILSEHFEELLVDERVKVVYREYEQGDLEGASLIIGATDSTEVNEAVHCEAKQRNIPINVVDQPQLCDFILPAVHEQGYLTLTASTHGKSPILARKIKEQWQMEYGEEYASFLEILGELRKSLMTSVESATLRKELLEKITQLQYIERMQHEKEKVYHELKETLGL